MKNAAQNSPASSASRSARQRATARRQADFSPSETRSLLSDSRAAREHRLGVADMISPGEGAQFVHTTREAIETWVRVGRAIGFTHAKRGPLLPHWQFEPSMWEALPRLTAALGTTEGWALLSFLESPHGGLDGITPRQAIEQGKLDRVIAIAEGEGT